MTNTSPSSTGGVGLIPGWEAKIPHASGPKNQNVKQKQYGNKFNKRSTLKKKKKDAALSKATCSSLGQGTKIPHDLLHGMAK